jgi:heme oxygenase (mycobilin-producing)
MAVKVLIKRRLPVDKARDMLAIFRKLRGLATQQEGYISGETLRNHDRPDEYLVISNWQSIEAWRHWLSNRERQELQAEIDLMLEEQTTYDVYHYGFTS